MKKLIKFIKLGLVCALASLATNCSEEGFFENNMKPADMKAGGGKGGGGNGGGGGGGGHETESVGNNLSFPVIWSEGVEKTLRQPPAGTIDNLKLGGAWWFVWGENPIDPSSPIFSCNPATSGDVPCYGPVAPADLYKAYLQKDENNFWEAYNAPATGVMNIDFIDWGDNLESVDWGVTSQVRTEVVLYETLPEPVLEYAMRHVSGWGADEVHGLQTTPNNEVVYGPGDQATVFSPHARLTIQRITSTTPVLTWNPTTHAWTGDINPPIFNKAVYEAGDGPGYYNAEINVKGKIIYGYTWNTKQLNDGAGTYRITFSFDNTAGSTVLNTFFDSNTAIIVPEEEEETTTVSASSTGGGGAAVIDVANNLTYMDVRITSGSRGRPSKPTVAKK